MISKLKHSRAKNQSGDTIVEVLIATAIVSLVLVSAFSICNISLRQIQMAKERGEAQKLAQQAIERLDRNVVKNYSSIIVPPTLDPFCDTQGTGVLSYSPLYGVCNPDRYHVSITRVGGAYTSEFKIRVWWDGLNGTEQQVIYNYRVASI